jgi:hypothetical protein
MHRTVCCWFLISSGWGGGWGRGGFGGGEAGGPSWRGRIRGVVGENKRGGGVVGSQCRVIKLLYAPDWLKQGDLVTLCNYSHTPTVWALKAPSWALHFLSLSLANRCVCTLRCTVLVCTHRPLQGVLLYIKPPMQL